MPWTLIVTVHYGLDLQDISLVQDHDTPLGHGEQFYEV